MSVELGPFSFERVIRAVERVRQRLQRAAAALEAGQVRYAVTGGSAVGLWVSRVDEAAVRNTPDVDILLRRSDLEAAKQAMGGAGFHFQETESGETIFLDGPDAKRRDCVRVSYANEICSTLELLSPDVTPTETMENIRVLMPEALVQIELTEFRTKNRVHLQDMISVGIVDASWKSRFVPELAERLQSLLDSPNG